MTPNIEQKQRNSTVTRQMDSNKNNTKTKKQNENAKERSERQNERVQ